MNAVFGMKNRLVVLILVFLSGLVLLGLLYGQQLFKNENRKNNGSSDGRVCIQVITPARNPQSGECKEFPTPCDVPERWEEVGSCN